MSKGSGNIKIAGIQKVKKRKAHQNNMNFIIKIQNTESEQ